MAETTSLTCAGCGWTAPAAAAHLLPFRCAQKRPGDDIDHVVVRSIDPAVAALPRSVEPNPFIRYRTLFHAYHLARSCGIADEAYVEIVQRLDRAVADVDGRGFGVTPWRRCARLSGQLGFSASGGVWVKDETGNVSGSHKARHLMGIMLYLTLLERAGLMPAGTNRPGSRLDPGPPAADYRPPSTGHPPLAIASCGNAALAAAVVARAGGWPLEVFVPPSADPSVLARLERLGASVHECARRPGVGGDPCYLAFQEAVRSGALPFCVQGSDNGLTIEGGETLAWEMIQALGNTRLGRLVVQVGGGALASACFQAFTEALAFGWIDRLPRLHAVQTQGGHPLARAHRLVAGRIAARGQSNAAIIRAELQYARTHRSQFMWPWETEPRSIAHGILDDETYDWAAVVEGMLRTGGFPIVVDEQRLRDANALARETTGVNVDHTGSAGLAGLMDLMEGPDPPSRDEHVAVVFSGVQRE